LLIDIWAVATDDEDDDDDDYITIVGYSGYEFCTYYFKTPPII
jgi:hypothetical protein